MDNHISLVIGDDELKWIDKLVESEKFTSRSHVIRYCVKLVRERGLVDVS